MPGSGGTAGKQVGTVLQMQVQARLTRCCKPCAQASYTPCDTGPNSYLPRGVCDISCRRCTPCPDYNYCVYCTDLAPHNTRLTCAQLARPEPNTCHQKPASCGSAVPSLPRALLHGPVDGICHALPAAVNIS